MSYLLDRKTQRKKLSRVAITTLIIFTLFYFRHGIWNSLSHVFSGIFRPVWIVGNYTGDRLGNLGSYFSSKNALYQENSDLKSQLREFEAKISNYNSLLAENISMKEILGRKDEKTTFVISAILSKPNKSPYDTLIIDAGSESGITKGSLVLARGDIPIGRIADVYPAESKVVLFSTSGEATNVVISSAKGNSIIPDSEESISNNESKSIFAEAVGRGGGNFEIVLPRDFSPTKGDEASLPGITPRVLGVVQKVISDPRDPFIKALLTSPINIQSLRFVEIEIK